MKLKIGNVTLKNNVVLAPLAGITDLPFRLICKRFNPGLVCSEMISSHGLVISDREDNKISIVSEKEKPVSVQIFGSNIDILTEAAKKVEANGADILDINFGCSVRKVLKSNSGSAVLKDLDLMKRIVSAVTGAVKIPVTVKMRSGADEKNIVAAQAALACQESGAAAVTIHPRTTSQLFRGKADWNVIKQVKEAVTIPVIGNGDIKDELDAERMLEATGCDGIMIGRAVFGDPWVLKRILTYLETGKKLPLPTYREKLDMLLEHAKMLIDYKGEKTGALQMRKFALWYIKGLPNAGSLRKKFVKCSNLDDYRRCCEESTPAYE